MYNQALLDRAIAFTQDCTFVSISTYQRVFKLPYPTACKLLHELQDKGIVARDRNNTGVMTVLQRTEKAPASAEADLHFTPYTRPELTGQERSKAESCAKRLVAKYGYANLSKMIAMLVLENARLAKEINEHRAPLGIEPLPLYTE